ncbi:hypothetical protein CVS28_12390 [Arthrobacter glacialis]|uniref:SPOR domain-containing protein n=2 Tax=Arthrobacter glacialis TaxID=1664 RepID=A0A2S3ZU93_ARTGL|nr:SPOR domain-containing protein [Arthrobacter glacialis]POH58237.1 hypothetical protein CVS28_12390 [Arthrobacter glacialis]POH72826.1 hypothetical protein CVS27_13185 [Arthrobacter glacialis]
MAQYWYNVETHQVEKDAQSGWRSLIGPYESREEAEGALAKVRERNEAADALDQDEDDAE